MPLPSIIHNCYGQAGEKWLKDLPGIIKECSELWDIEILEGNTGDSFAYVTPVRRKDGREAMLKISFPKEKDNLTEMMALEKYKNTEYFVRLLEKSDKHTAVLLEHLSPGTSLRVLSEEDDTKATEIAAHIMKNLSVPIETNHPFPTIRGWASVLPKVLPKLPYGPVSRELVERGIEVFEELEASKTEDILLHGDLHHENILYDDVRGWVAIDPKGLVGDPAFNTARFIRSVWNLQPSLDLYQNRIDSIADITGYEKKRIAGWSFVDLLISNCWYIDEQEHPDFASVFEDIRDISLQLLEENQ